MTYIFFLYIHLFLGSVIALFQTSPLPTSISQAVTTILSDLNAIPDLSVSSVNINGRSYSSSSTTSSSNNNNSNNTTKDAEKNIGLIVGVIIPLVVVILLIVGGIFARRAYNKKMNQRRPIGVSEDNIRTDDTNQSRTTLPRESMDSIHTSNEDYMVVTPIINPPSSPRPYRINSAATLDQSRPQTPSINIQLDEDDDDQPRSRNFPLDLKLIDLD